MATSACSSNAMVAVSPPVVDFSIENNNCNAPCVVTFTNRSRDAVEYEWDFGNGSTSTVTSPSILYDSRGTYNVMLTAINAGGARSISKEVVIE